MLIVEVDKRRRKSKAPESNAMKTNRCKEVIIILSSADSYDRNNMSLTILYLESYFQFDDICNTIMTRTRITTISGIY